MEIAMSNKFTFAVSFSSGDYFEETVRAATEQEARKIVWENIEPHTKDAVEDIDLVDVVEVDQ
jgi:hypothetical protein